MSDLKRIGILGGTFDPLHLGHLIIASHAADGLDLDQVLFMPAQIPPHKLDLVITDTAHRVEMVQRGIRDDDRFAVSDLDLRRDAPSYTSELVARLAKELPGTALHFIAGADSLRDFPTWHEPREILKHAELAIAARPGTSITDEMLESVPTLRTRTRIFESPLIDISSTTIRNRVHHGRSIRYLVPADVETYIEEHGLYS